MSDSKQYASKLAGQRVLIIGGTGGIGIALAKACIENGAEVILSSSRDSSIQSAIGDVLADYPSAKSRLSGFPYDLSGTDMEVNIENLFKQVGGNVDHIVYMVDNSGVPSIGVRSHADFEIFNRPAREYLPYRSTK